MAGQDSYQTKTEFGYSLPHLMGLGGILGGMALLIFISSQSQPVRREKIAAESIAGKNPVPESEVVQKAESASDISTERLVHIPPAIVERSPFLLPRHRKKLMVPVVSPAIAEKPPVTGGGS